jgi:galactose mutarotase-like enzyme
MSGREGISHAYSAERATYGGHDAIVLRREGVDGPLRSVFLPDLGLLGASLTANGEELLGRTEELDNYVGRGATVGIPLLHPWANRLGGLAYRAGGHQVQLDAASPLLHFDANGLPMHGVPGSKLAWRVTGLEADADAARLSAELDWRSGELLAVFPYAHRLEVTARLESGGLTLSTTLTPAAEAVVPISFGYHPYLRLPGTPRAEWRVSWPPMHRLELDAHGIPTGAESPFNWGGDDLGDVALDDAFAGLTDGASFGLATPGRRIALTFVEGYRFAQIYAPRGRDFIAVEPMTAPANALVSGRGLRLVSPGASFRAAFRIEI